MKTAEEILKHIDSTFVRPPYGISKDNREKIKSLIRDVQNDAYNQAIEDNKEKILTITGEDNPYSLRSVLEHLIWAAKYLLHVKNYDGNRYEELGQCVRRAEEIRKSILRLKK